MKVPEGVPEAVSEARGPLGTIGVCGTALQTPFLEQQCFRDTDVPWARLQRHTRKLNVAAQRCSRHQRLFPAGMSRTRLTSPAGRARAGLCRFLG